MGSYQREWSDKVEAKVCKNNNFDLTENNFSLGDATSLETGNIYEIKASSTNSFKFNTLANIGQDSLTKYKIFNCISWRDFRKLQFDKEKEKISNNLSMKEIKENHVDKKEKIENLSTEDKINYINLLKTSSYDREALKIFLINLLKGSCKRNHYNANISEEDLESSNYILVNSSGEEKMINKKKLFEGINFNNLYFKFEDKATSIKVCDGKNDILRISFHWKNKFQGGETPCLNIFLSSKFNNKIKN